MFGFSIFEVLVVLVVAIIFLGPDKLPKLIVDIVKFFKVVKKTLNEAKETFDKELQISEIKKEALEYKKQFEDSVDSVTKDVQLSDIDTMFDEYKSKENLEVEQKPNNNEMQIESHAQEAKQNPKNKKTTVKPKIGKTTSFKKKEAKDV